MDAECLGKAGTRFLAPPDFFHPSRRQLVAGIPLSPGLSALCIAVLGVFLICTDKEVIRPAAWRIVAGVKNSEPFRDFLALALIGEAMGLDHFPVQPETAVSVVVSFALIFPALPGFIDFLPESYFAGFAWVDAASQGIPSK